MSKVLLDYIEKSVSWVFIMKLILKFLGGYQFLKII